MKLAIYTIEVHAPDDFTDADWPEYSQNLLEGVFEGATEAIETKVKDIDSRLTVKYHD